MTSTFVLVHGGWGGGWEWRQVAEALAAEGHRVHRPTLTGLGERHHLSRRDVDLETHIKDVVSVLECENLTNVVLVGQSYGGAVITGVADRVPELLNRVVYVDAFIPGNGQSVNELSPPGFVARLRQLAHAQTEDWLVPLPFTREELGLPENIVEWYAPRLTSQPMATLDQPIELTGATSEVPHSYIDCRPADAETWVFAGFAEHARKEGWDVRSLPVGHDAHVIAPDRLAEMLHDIASG